MIPTNDKISIRQLQILTILEIFGIGIISLPNTAAQFANQDGWFLIITATLLAVIYTYIITSLGRMFPEDSFTTYASKIVTKPIGIILSIGLVIKILLSTALQLRFFCEVIHQTILPKTPFYLVCAIMLLLGGYCASKGFETRARLGELLILLILVPLIFMLIVSCIGADWTNLMPVMTSNPTPILKGTFWLGVSFTGLEFLLFVHPYVNKPKNVRKGSILAILIVGTLMLLVTIVTIATFGPSYLKEQTWPVLSMMDMINLPASFLERQGALIMSFWIISVFATVNAGLFFSSLLLKDTFNKGTHSYYIIGCILLIFLISFIPQNLNDVLEMMNIVFATFGIAYLFFVPLVLLIIAKARRLGND